MKIFRKILSIIVFLIPIIILVVGCIIKGISVSDAGLLMFGIIIAIVGSLYVFFAAKPENKIPLGCIILGLFLSICSFISLIIGLCLIASPISFILGGKLWKNKKN